MTVKSVLHRMANELNRPHWHDEIDEEDPDTKRDDDLAQGDKDPITGRPRGGNDDAESGVKFEGTAKPATLGGGSSKDGETTDGNG